MAFGGLPSEIEQRLTYADFVLLQVYADKHGPFSYERRYDRVGAIAAWTTAAVNGGKGKLEDFMPFGRKEAQPWSFQEVAAAMTKAK